MKPKRGRSLQALSATALRSRLNRVRRALAQLPEKMLITRGKMEAAKAYPREDFGVIDTTFMGFSLTDEGLAQAKEEERRLIAALSNVQQRERALLARRGFDETTTAAAAAYFGKTREQAHKVKIALREQVKVLPACPYCGNALAGQLHADHIHPVCLGGLSVPENMVYVCATCNAKKHDKTLREYVRDEDLDWPAIESRLTLLCPFRKRA